MNTLHQVQRLHGVQGCESHAIVNIVQALEPSTAFIHAMALPSGPKRLSWTHMSQLFWLTTHSSGFYPAAIPYGGS